MRQLAARFAIPPDEQCPTGLIYYPSDENYTTLICDCSDDELQIYDPETDACYYPYTRGPCAPEYYYVLPEGEEVAECEPNPCDEGLVPYDGGCYKLGASEPPCKQNVTYLTVELITLKIKCLKPFGRVAGYVHTIYGGIINAPLKECRKGSRRIYSGKCKRELL
ncbi:uncharacterized protein LOC122510074 isoform X2 [Leptopilina heterotoma]|uniref:uncharacterized protein LOC122510074 isoform X2 n=1 Tax=Leptopilina heterotoma TaxID=63436 RepID=UPI001CAA2BB0|nr:uncharacterized protein LOC122510074 isoform X2 [Leptopilina heterotoma]